MLINKHTWAQGVVILTLIAVPIAYGLTHPLVVVLLAAVPGAVAAFVAVDLHRQTRDRHRDTVEWERVVGRRLRAIQRSSNRSQERSDEGGTSAERWQADVVDRIAVLTEVVQQSSPARVDAVTHEDLLGAVKVLQAGYEGRLDRAQATLEEAMRVLQLERGVSIENIECEQSASDSRRPK